MAKDSTTSSKEILSTNESARSFILSLREMDFK